MRGLSKYLVLVAAALVLSGCRGLQAYDLPFPGKQVDPDDGYQVSAEFADVVDIVPRSLVLMRAEYERTLPDSADRHKQSDTGVKVVAKVIRAGVMSLTKDDATVLVFVNQRASAKSTKKVLESPTWEILRMVRQDGDWLLSGMEAP